MCFSASISFGASVLLLGTGVSAIKKVESPKMLAFASIPILFGIQQLSEGILWLTLPDPDLINWQRMSIYLFLIFAQIIWPIWIPLSMWLIEKDKGRKKILRYLLILGATISTYLIYWVLTSEVSAFIIERHIKYSFYYPNQNLYVALYLLSTIPPLFIASLKKVKVFGWSLIGSLALSYIFFFHYIVSVWCFFAAILSVQILLIIVYNKKEQKAPSTPLKKWYSHKVE